MQKIDKQNSLLYRTQQSWKLYVLYVMTLSAAIFIGGGLYWRVYGHDQGDIFIFIGGFMAGVGSLFPCLIIRCPKCGSYWYWLIIKKYISKNISTEWYDKIYEQKECPDCGWTNNESA